VTGTGDGTVPSREATAGPRRHAVSRALFRARQAVRARDGGVAAWPS